MSQQFTKTPPSDKGWYWWRPNEHQVPQILYVDWGAIASKACLMFWQAGSNIPNPVDEYGEWLGPIEVPCEDSK